MGTEWSSQSVTGCRLDERVEMPSASTTKHTTCWALHKAVSSTDCSPLSVFVYNLTNLQNSDRQQELLHSAQNNAMWLKRLRHPCIVRFVDMSLTTDEVWIITERVIPLQLIIDSLSPDEICSGLYNIIEAFIFLHSKAGLCHNNVSMESVFVSETGVWKLGAMELMCHPTVLTTSSQVNIKLSSYCKDVCEFVRLAEYILEYLSTLGGVTTHFEKKLQKVLSECSKEPPDVNHHVNNVLSHLLDDDIFRNDFIDITNFIRDITVKTDEEKAKFFSNIVQRLYNLPVHLVGSRLIKPLLSRFVLLNVSACHCLLPHLLAPYPGNVRRDVFVKDVMNPILPSPLYQRYVLPELFKMFHVRDVHVRCVLLQHFHNYAQLFDRHILTCSILPQLLLGVRDVNDKLVSLSLQAIASLVPILGGDVVIGANRQQIFSDGQPKIYSNVSPPTTLLNGALHNDDGHPSSSSSSAAAVAREAGGGQKLKNENKNKSLQLVKHELLTGRPTLFSGNSSCVLATTVDQSTCDTEEIQGDCTADYSVVDSEGWQMDNSLSGYDSELTSAVSLCELVTARPTASSVLTHEATAVCTSTNISSNCATCSPTHSTIRGFAVSTMKSKFVADQPLGAECDIKQITVKQRRQSESIADTDFDFFADMTPHIDVKSSDSLLNTLLTDKQRSMVTSQQVSSRFAVNNNPHHTVNTEADSDGGWDVDFDWNSTLH